MGMGICCLKSLKEEMHVIDWLEAQNEDPIISKGYQVGAIGKGEVSNAPSWGLGIHLGRIGIH